MSSFGGKFTQKFVIDRNPDNDDRKPDEDFEDMMTQAKTRLPTVLKTRIQEKATSDDVL